MRDKILILFVVLICGCTKSYDSVERPPAPNVVLIFVDDMGYADLSGYGAEAYATPNLDRMADEGLRFTDFYVNQPVCSASRAALLTGSYSNRIGIHGALGPANTHGIHPDEVTLAELFKSQGYTTAIFGKWHLGHHPEFLPTRHGFDEYYGIPYSNDMWPYHPENPDAWGDLPTLEGEEVVGYNTDQTRFTTDFTNRSVGFIEAQVSAGNPFFLYLAHPMPHVPIYVSDERKGAGGAGLYGDVIVEIDWSVGRILETLERLGVDENTLVMFASDNGPWLSYGNHAGKADPLREGKGTTFEGGVRVPFLARWPGVLEEGRVVAAPAMTIDIFPTLAGLLNAPLPAHGIDGRSIWSIMAGETDEPQQEAYFFYYRQNELQAMRSGKWKLHFPHSYRTMEGREPGKDGTPGKYNYDAQIGLALFDLSTDVSETTNVAADHPAVVDRLTSLADSMRLELGDRLEGIEGQGVRPPGRVVVDAE